jgi:1-deoxy-D-xylulose-5-phosphate reductoisomerase
MKQICLLGATGSIGDSTLDVVRQHPERFQVQALAAASNWKKAAELVREFGVQKVAMWNAEAAAALQKELNMPVGQGMEGLLELVEYEKVDTVVNALVGAVGCLPTIRSIEKSHLVALANKETLVMAGDVIRRKLEEFPRAEITPIDSEHSAVFQALAGRPVEEVESIQLTASGGPFRELPAEKFADITLEQALKHPTWSMGPKITIDSATMMNKGLEVIEAYYLFGVDFDQIEVVVHPQSIIHSMVQFRDGSLMAQLGAPDMKIPIIHALSEPERPYLQTERAKLSEIGKLTFFAPDFARFPCLRLAYEAGRAGGTKPAILNAANEEMVAAFLEEKIAFTDIPLGNEWVLNQIENLSEPSLDDILTADAQARALAQSYIQGVR